MEKKIPTLKDLEKFAREFITANSEGRVVGLSGELGAGKTAFVRECIAALAEGPSPRVTSPTYVLHQRYPRLKRPIEHFDLYRLENITPQALNELGYFDAVEFAREKKGFVFVEWPEKCETLQSLGLDIHLKFSIEGSGRLAQFL